MPNAKGWCRVQLVGPYLAPGVMEGPTTGKRLSDPCALVVLVTAGKASKEDSSKERSSAFTLPPLGSKEKVWGFTHLGFSSPKVGSEPGGSS